MQLRRTDSLAQSGGWLDALINQLAAETTAPHARLYGLCLIIWLVTLAATPITLWVFGPEYFPPVASVGVLAQAAASLFALSLTWPLGRVARTVLIAVGITWLAEFLGVLTGLPFGRYHYTTAMQPQLLGVPIIIPMAWLMMLAPTWGLVARLLPQYNHLSVGQRLLFAALTALAFTAWDLYLDPQMVSRGLWVWQQPGLYFGIPLINFGGWLLTSFILTLLINPTHLAGRHLLIIYTLTWLFQAVGQGVLWGQPGPALFGFLGMGVFAVLAWRKEVRAWTSSSGRSSDSSPAPSRIRSSSGD